MEYNYQDACWLVYADEEGEEEKKKSLFTVMNYDARSAPLL